MLYRCFFNVLELRGTLWTNQYTGMLKWPVCPRDPDAFALAMFLSCWLRYASGLIMIYDNMEERHVFTCMIIHVKEKTSKTYQDPLGFGFGFNITVSMYMGVSENNGTPKSSILGYLHFRKHPYSTFEKDVIACLEPMNENFCIKLPTAKFGSVNQGTNDIFSFQAGSSVFPGRSWRNLKRGWCFCREWKGLFLENCCWYFKKCGHYYIIR